ncbi:MAG: magnesium/cobalt transporter CorA [Candidatus Euphemobacter frigidus]|nr:magnesium/cobalt transporter CorA [Candidatus Euphemobacter frigidus]MDP8275018.1 magnesium/cobalt transporter CorA [Candidatus Euphemobacter frigidus]
MARFIKKRYKAAGLPPGTPVYIGEEKAEKVRISVIDYDESQFQEKEVESVEECLPFKDIPTVTWINIDGLHQTEIIEKIGKHFGLHPLVIEDIVNTGQRPKVEDFGEYIFVVLKMLGYDDKKTEVTSEQVSLVLGSNFVISFQEKLGDVFETIRSRIREGKGRIRKMGVDYLTYALVDSVVDYYFFILEKLGDKIEEVEEELVSDPKPETLQMIHSLKRELLFIRKSVWPLREVISGLQRGEYSLISDATVIYFRDVYDHTIQVIDTVETFRDMVSGMLDTYLSSISNRMNEVMKVLTIIATIFIPLTFIVGIYGMNFEFMPELKWHWSYPAVWLVMIGVFIGMIVYFKKKKWL